MLKVTARCPKDPTHKEFITTAIVSEDWRVDEHGTFLDVNDDGGEIVHGPDPDNIWTCAECGEQAIVKSGRAVTKLEVGVEMTPDR